MIREIRRLCIWAVVWMIAFTAITHSAMTTRGPAHHHIAHDIHRPTGAASVVAHNGLHRAGADTGQDGWHVHTGNERHWHGAADNGHSVAAPDTLVSAQVDAPADDEPSSSPAASDAAVIPQASGCALAAPLHPWVPGPTPILASRPLTPADRPPAFFL